MEQTTKSRTLTVEQAAKLLEIGRGTAYEAARRGELPTIRFGRRLLVPRAKLLALLGENGGVLADVRARVARLNEALEDGDVDLARQIGRDLETDLAGAGQGTP